MQASSCQFTDKKSSFSESYQNHSALIETTERKPTDNYSDDPECFQIKSEILWCFVICGHFVDYLLRK